MSGPFSAEKFLATLNGELTEDFLFFTEQARALLLSIVDAWLNTGRRPDGPEDPRERDFSKAPEASNAVLRGGAVKLKAVGNSISVRFRSHLPESAHELERDSRRPWTERERDMADRLFTLCCLSGFHLKVAQCCRCRRYFDLKHWNREYKRGTACPACARVRSGVLSTAKARDCAEAELYRLTAQRFASRIAKTRGWSQDQKLRTAIVEFLNDRIQGNESLMSVYPHGVTGKWLSWAKNRSGIETALKGKSDAKSQRT